MAGVDRGELELHYGTYLEGVIRKVTAEGGGMRILLETATATLDLRVGVSPMTRVPLSELKVGRRIRAFAHGTYHDSNTDAIVSSTVYPADALELVGP